MPNTTAEMEPAYTMQKSRTSMGHFPDDGQDSKIPEIVGRDGSVVRAYNCVLSWEALKGKCGVSSSPVEVELNVGQRAGDSRAKDAREPASGDSQERKSQ